MGRTVTKIQKSRCEIYQAGIGTESCFGDLKACKYKNPVIFSSLVLYLYNTPCTYRRSIEFHLLRDLAVGFLNVIFTFLILKYDENPLSFFSGCQRNTCLW